MIKDNYKKISSWRRLTTIFFALLFVGVFLFSEKADAIPNDYNKIATSTLTASEWNNLVNDFVKTWENTQMTGSLGIGRTPNYSLDVNTDIFARRYLGVGSFNGNAPGISGWALSVQQADQALALTTALNTSDANGRVLSVNASGESFARGVLYSSGVYGLGGGTASRDVFIGRSAANTLKLGSTYNLGGSANLLISGRLGIGGSSVPNDTLSISSSGGIFAPSGSLNTGHNYTSTYLTSDDYALTNYGIVKTLIGDATNPINATIASSSFWAGSLTGNIWTANTGNVGIGTSTPASKLDIYNGNINIDDTTNANRFGIITKNGTRFIHNFNYGNNGVVTTIGGNTFVGLGAGNLDSGSTATAALNSSYNTGLGHNALTSVTTGSGNNAFGYEALYGNTTGVDNIAIGWRSLKANTSGGSNIAIGWQSMLSNTTGNFNTALGNNSLKYNTTASYNAAFGNYALNSNTIGTYNTAVGPSTLQSNTEGSYNTAIGGFSLYKNLTGRANTAIGYTAGYKFGITPGSTDYLTVASTSVFIGTNARPLANSQENQIVIGYNAYGAGSNSVVLGNDSVVSTILKGNVGIGTTAPNDRLSIASDSGVAAPIGSANTGHNYTSTYLSTDDFALTNYGIVKTLIGDATNPINATIASSSFWSGSLTGNIWTANTGNVGIGTNNPFYKLSIVGNQSLDRFSDDANSAIMVFRKARGTASAPTDVAHNDILGEISVRGYNDSAGDYNSSSKIQFLTSYPNSGTDTSDMSGIISFLTSSDGYSDPLERMRINDSGNVGIGTNNPTARLDIQRDGSNAELRVTGGWGNDSAILTLRGNGNTNSWSLTAASSTSLTFSNANTGVKPITMLNSGNVGIGTTNPQLPLDVVGYIRSSQGYKFTGSTNGQFTISSGNTYFDYEGGFNFRSLPSYGSSLYLTNAGNVGIGTTAPNDILSLANGGTAAPAGSSNTGHNFTSTYLSTDNFALANYGIVKTLVGDAISSSSLWGGTTAGDIWSLNSGNVGIGTNAPTSLIHVSNAYNTSGSYIAQIDNTYVGSGGPTAMRVKQRTQNNSAGSSIGFVMQSELFATTQNSSASSIVGGDYINLFYPSGYNVSTPDSIGLRVRTPILSGTGPSNISIASSRGILIQNQGGSSMTNSYGLYIDAQSGSSNSNYSIYSAGGINYLEGNVGIGTNNPAVKLQVEGVSRITPSSGNYFSIVSSSTLTSALEGIALSIDSRNAILGSFDNSNFSTALKFNHTNNTSVDDRLSLITSGAERLTIDNLGNIGIGTTNPGDKLEVNGDVGIINAGKLSFGSNLQNPSYIKAVWNDNNNTGLEFHTFYGAVDIPALTLSRTGGSVGVGTTAPNDRFSIAGDAGTAAPAGSSNTGHNFTSTYLSTDNFALANYGIVKTLVGDAISSSSLWGGTTSGNIWSLNSGSVGIGTTSPSGSLDIYGNTGTKLRIGVFTDNSSDDPQLQMYSGKATRPAYTFIGNNDTGMWRPSSNAIAFSTGASERLRIDASGNVGIGTTNPIGKLNIGGTAGVTWGTGTVGGLVTIGDQSTGGSLWINTGSHPDLGLPSGLSIHGSYSWPISTINIAARGVYWNGYGSNLTFSTTQSTSVNERMRITSAGNVGIGTTAPNDILSLANGGSAAPAGSSNTGHNYTSTYLSTDNFALANYGIVKTLVGDAISSSSLWGGTTSGNIWSLNSGNVGIGTASPDAKLHVAGDLKVNGSAFINKQHFADNIYSHANGTLISTNITVSDNQMMELYIEGNSYGAWGAVGGKVTAYNYTGNNTIVGTAYVTDGIAPSEVRVFHQDGVVKFWMPTSSAQTYRFRLATSFGSGGFKITGMSNVAMPTTGVTNEVVLTPKTVVNNSVGIGYSNPSYKLDVNGDIRASDRLIVGDYANSVVNSGEAWLFRAADRASGTLTIQLGGSSAASTKFEIVDRAWTKVISSISGEAPGGSFTVQPGGNVTMMGGNVGIGTTSPEAKLNISNSGAGSLGSSLTINGGSTTDSALIKLSRGGTGRISGLQYQTANSDNWFSGIYYNGGSSQSNYGIGTNYLVSNQKFVITSAGSVGIGTTAPNDILSLANGGSAAPAGSSNTGHNYTSTYLSTDNFALANYGIVKTLVGDAISSSSLWGGTTTGNIWALNSGNVGIGTTGPNTKLHIYNAATGVNELLRLENKYGAQGDGGFIRFTNQHSAGTNPNSGEYNLAGIKAYDYDNVWGGALDFQTPNSGVSGGGNLITRMTIAPGGNVGIGTTSPNNKLDILTATRTGSHSSGNGLYVTANGTSIAGIAEFDHTNGGMGLSIGYAGLSTTGSNSLEFGVQNATRMVINSSGNVGIGTTSPTALIHTATTGTTVSAYFSRSDSNSLLKLERTANTAVFDFKIANGAWNTRDLYIQPNSDASSFSYTNADGTPLWHIRTNTGNVGIGTTNPSLKLSIFGNNSISNLTVRNATGTVLVLDNTVPSYVGGGGKIVFGSNYYNAGSTMATAIVGSYKEYAPDNGSNEYKHSLIFSTADSPGITEKMRITSNGRVGIGTTAPNDILSLANGGSAAPAGSSNTGHNYTSTYLSTDNFALANYGIVKTLVGDAISSSSLWGGTTTGNIWALNSGNVGIGTSSPGYKLDVAGDIRLSGKLFGDSDSSRNLVANNIYNTAVSGYQHTSGRVLTSGTTRFNFSRESSYSTNYARVLTPGYYSVSFWYKVENYSSGSSISIDINDRSVSSIDISSNKDWTFHSGTAYISSTLYGFLDMEGTFNATVTISDLVVNRSTKPSSQYVLAPEDTVQFNPVGNVSIGTSTPVSLLTLYGSNPRLSIANNVSNSGTTGIDFILNNNLTYERKNAIVVSANGTYGKGDMSFVLDSANDSNNYDVAADTKMIIKNSGNVGIGTTGPAAKLDVSGVSFNSAPGMLIQGSSATTNLANDYAALTFVNTNQTANNFAGFMFSDNINGTNAAAGMYTIFTDHVNNYGDYAFATRGPVGGYTEKMRITSGGNVGIGTSVPNDILSLANGGSAAPAGSSNTGHNYTSTYLSTDNFALANYGIVKTLVGDAISSSSLWSGSTSGDIWALNSGNVGIGTSNPLAKTHIYNNTTDANTALIINQNNLVSTGKILDLQFNGSSLASFDKYGVLLTNAGIRSANQNLRLTPASSGLEINKISGTGNIALFQYNDATKMVVTYDGSVGVGITNPQFKVHGSADGVSIASGLLSGTSPTIGASGQNSNVNMGIIGASNTATQRPLLQFIRSRGTLNSPSVVQNNDNMGDVLFGAYDGAAVQHGAGLFAFVDGTPSSGNVPARLSFVTGSNAGNRQERLTIKSDGKVGIGTTAPNDRFSIAGDAGTSAPAGSANTGHNFTSTYLSTDNFALANYGIVKTLLSDAITPIQTGIASSSFWSGSLTGNIWSANSGNIGIGTGSPSTKLHLWGAASTTPVMLSFPNGNINNNYTGIVFSGETPKAGILFASNAAGYARGNLIFATSDSNDYSGINLSNERMRIADNGNVAIGTTNTAIYKLNVNGSANIAGDLNVVGAITGVTMAGTINAANVSSGPFADETGGGDFSFPGKLGIGTINPFLRLSVIANSDGDGIQIRRNSTSGSAYSSLGFRTNTTEGGNYGEIRSIRTNVDGGGNSDLSFFTYNNALLERMRILHNGNIGIGTAAPNALLELYKAGSNANLKLYAFSSSAYDSQVQFSANTNAAVEYSLGLDNNDNNFKIYSGENVRGTSEFVINPSGNIGISTTDPSEAKLVINAGTGMALKAYGHGIFTGTLQTQSGSDFAEEFATTKDLEPGTVVVMDDKGYKSVKPSSKSYDKTVVGIVSNNPSIIAGQIDSKHKAIIAMMGVVKVKVTSVNGQITRGDLLTTSNITGHAMKTDGSKPGTIIGKALEDLNGSRGEINVLVNLQ